VAKLLPIAAELTLIVGELLAVVGELLPIALISARSRVAAPVVAGPQGPRSWERS
jgi:hypothetical protein